MPLEISHKFRRKRRQIFLKRIFIISFVFMLVFWGAAYVADRSLRVAEIRVLGTEGISEAEIKNYAGDFLGRGFLSSWFKENVIFFRPNNLEEELKKQFSAINNIEVSRNFAKKTVEIQIRERDNWAVWCGQKCFYMDAGGVIFKEAPKFFGQLFLKVDDERKIPFKEGDQVMDTVVLKNMKNEFMNRAENLGLKIKNIEIKENREFWLYSDYENTELNWKSPFKMILDAETDFGKAGENMALFLESAAKEKIKRIDYVDLRFKDKIFYK